MVRSNPKTCMKKSNYHCDQWESWWMTVKSMVGLQWKLWNFLILNMEIKISYFGEETMADQCLYLALPPRPQRESQNLGLSLRLAGPRPYTENKSKLSPTAFCYFGTSQFCKIFPQWCPRKSSRKCKIHSVGLYSPITGLSLITAFFIIHSVGFCIIKIFQMVITIIFQ